MQYDRYYLTVFNGLNEIARDELTHKFDDLRVETIHKGREHSLLVVRFPDDPVELQKVRIAEDIFYLLDVITLDRSKDDLSRIKEKVLQSHYLERGLRVHRLFRQKIRKGRTAFRVVAQATHKYGYRRVDAQKVVEKAIANRYNQKWKLVEDNPDIEFWLHLIGNKAILGIRLSTARMRQRAYKKVSLPGSLRPTIAFGMVWLSGIQPNDIFLDPMCGSGTILIERAESGAYKQLLGGDSNPQAIEATQVNIGDKYKPISVQLWDAAQLPLADMSVNKICCNLPFGKLIGTPTSIKKLYHSFLKEAERVLKPRGTMVLLSSQNTAVEQSLADTPLLTCVTMHRNVDVLGQNATIFVIHKHDSLY
jgi:23S rRNA G2445 N2-methylase RlmL